MQVFALRMADYISAMLWPRLDSSRALSSSASAAPTPRDPGGALARARSNGRYRDRPPHPSWSRLLHPLSARAKPALAQSKAPWQPHLTKI